MSKQLIRAIDNEKDPLAIDDESDASADQVGNHPFAPAGGPSGMPITTSMGVIGTTFSVMDDADVEQDEKILGEE